MSNDGRDSEIPPKPRRSWFSRLSSKSRHSEIVETVERRTQRTDTRSEGNDSSAPPSDGKSTRSRARFARFGSMAPKETGGIDDEETTGEIMLDLEEARRKLDEAVKKKS